MGGRDYFSQRHFTDSSFELGSDCQRNFSFRAMVMKFTGPKVLDSSTSSFNSQRMGKGSVSARHLFSDLVTGKLPT